MKKKTLSALVASLAVLLTVLLTGCGSAAPYANALALDNANYSALYSDVANTVNNNTIQSYGKEDQASPYITLEKAKEIALTHAGVSADSALWDDRDFDLENGKSVFELEFSANGTEYEYDIDATDGKILHSKVDHNDDRPASSTTNTSKPTTSTDKPAVPTYIGVDEAKAAALKKAGVSAADVRWENAELDRDDGIPVYELEFSANGVEYDCDVHAETGKVVKLESEKDDDRPVSSSTTNTSKPTTSTDKPAVPTYIGVDEAKAAALKKAGVSAADVRWENAELDRDDGIPVYELEFSANGVEYDCDVHAETGKVVKLESEKDDDRPVSSSTNTSKPATSADKPAAPSYIGVDEAKAAALKKAGVSAADVRWENAELDRDDGIPVYELEFSANGVEYDCDVHAETGKIVKFESERDD